MRIVSASTIHIVIAMALFSYHQYMYNIICEFIIESYIIKHLCVCVPVLVCVASVTCLFSIVPFASLHIPSYVHHYLESLLEAVIACPASIQH